MDDNHNSFLGASYGFGHGRRNGLHELPLLLRSPSFPHLYGYHGHSLASFYSTGQAIYNCRRVKKHEVERLKKHGLLLGLGLNVIVLGIASLLTDISSSSMSEGTGARDGWYNRFKTFRKG